ncbi:unnamed protein product [Heterosigma akashiwo]
MPADKKTLVPIWLTQEVVLCAVAKMAMSYNVICIDLTLDIMADIYDETDSQEDVVSVALIAGMIIGQLGLGFLGDIIGRTKALLITLCLAIFGSLGSTLLSFDPDPFIWIAVWRFFMGIGCGGVYPLAATIAKESVEDKELQGTAVSFVFSMQGIGYILSPAITLLICSTVSDKNLQWRLVLGAGAVLLLAVAWVFYWLPPRARPNKLLDAAQSSGRGRGWRTCGGWRARPSTLGCCWARPAAGSCSTSSSTATPSSRAWCWMTCSVARSPRRTWRPSRWWCTPWRCRGTTPPWRS